KVAPRDMPLVLCPRPARRAGRVTHLPPGPAKRGSAPRPQPGGASQQCPPGVGIIATTSRRDGRCRLLEGVDRPHPLDVRLDGVQVDLDLPLSLRLRMRPEALLDPGEPEHPERIKAIGQRTIRPEPRDDGDTLPMGDDD